MTWFDDNEDRAIYGRRHSRFHTPVQEPRCDRCYSTEVRWRQQGGKWVLFSLQPGVLHVCPIPDEFEAVPE